MPDRFPSYSIQVSLLLIVVYSPKKCQIKLRLANLSGPMATHFYYAHFES